MGVRDWKGTAKMTVKKLGEIIGTTTDASGTSTAGTLMAKVNAVLNSVANGVKVSGSVTAIGSAIGGGHASLSKTGTLLNINGKGKLFIRTVNSSNKVDVTVDGNKIISNMSLGSELTTEIEFLNSIKVDISSYNSSTVYCNYVLY